MKRKMLVVTMVIAMMMASLMAACGSNDVPANAIIDTPAPTSTPDPTAEPTITPDDGNDESGVVESGTLDDVPDENEGSSLEEGIRYDYTTQWALDGKNTNCEAWTDSYRFVNDPSMAFNCTYFKTINGDEMSFTWVAPSEVGSTVALSNDGITITMSNVPYTHYLSAWNYGKMSNEGELMKNYDANTIMGVASATPIENTFQVEETNEFYRVTFKVNQTINGKRYVGYHFYTDYLDIMECWQFEYLVEESIFDEETALAVVSSIEYANLDDLGIIVHE